MVNGICPICISENIIFPEQSAIVCCPDCGHTCYVEYDSQRKIYLIAWRIMYSEKEE